MGTRPHGFSDPCVAFIVEVRIDIELFVAAFLSGHIRVSVQLP